MHHIAGWPVCYAYMFVVYTCVTLLGYSVVAPHYSWSWQQTIYKRGRALCMLRMSCDPLLHHAYIIYIH